MEGVDVTELAEHHGVAKGYAWAMQDAGKGPTARPKGFTGSGDYAFACAYRAMWSDFVSEKRCSATNVQDAWRTWQRTNGRTLDYSSILYHGSARAACSIFRLATNPGCQEFRRSGAIDVRMEAEVTRALRAEDIGPETRELLESLVTYMLFYGPCGPQEGWVEKWVTP